MFIDEITIHLKAGKGGNGVVRWLHEKFKEFGGPSGGNGGKGGDVYIRAVRNVALLSKYSHEKKFEAKNGEDGGSYGKHGVGGDDFILDLPIGSVITNLETERQYELMEEGKLVKVLEGGLGGKGNKHFKASTNTRPKERTFGKVGDEADFYIELRLIADAGLIGLPNAGKSSLLNALTRARAKVASYAFTTLDPNLGSFYKYVIADIPGLIEGASEGKGLGYKFLRHIRRTKFLIHCISLENEDLKKVYKTIRGELKAYDKSLLEKEEVVVLTKNDLVDKKMLNEAKKIIKKLNKNVFDISILDDESIKNFSDDLSKIFKS